MAKDEVKAQCYFCKAMKPIGEMEKPEERGGYYFCDKRCRDGLCQFATSNTNFKENDDGEPE